MISETAKYNDSIGEWTIRGIAFAGNNVQEVSTFKAIVTNFLNSIQLFVSQKSPPTNQDTDTIDDELDLQHVYYTYK